MASSATLANLTVRVQNLLADTGADIFPAASITEAIRLAFQEYNTRRPLPVVGQLTVSAAGREQALASLTDLVSISSVWFPYTAATPEFPPSYVHWTIFDNAGALTLFIDDQRVAAPAVGKVLRIFYNKLHTLNGLDSATATTYNAGDDNIIVLGAAGYACLTRSVDLNETSANFAISTPNYGALGAGFLSEFRYLLNAPSIHGRELV